MKRFADAHARLASGVRDGADFANPSCGEKVTKATSQDTDETSSKG